MEHTNRTTRPLTQQDLEAYLDIYLNAYPAYKTLDEACREHYREKHRLELREDRQVQTVGLFEGDVLIATMKLILFSMNCFGRMQTACGLMALEVHPLHKKQGAALEMIRIKFSTPVPPAVTSLLPRSLPRITRLLNRSNTLSTERRIRHIRRFEHST